MYAVFTLTALLLSGCGRSTEAKPETNPTLLGDAIAVVANLENDVLIPPEAPQLSIHLVDGTLDFIWQAQPDTTEVKLYSYNASSEIESLISDTIDNTANAFSAPISLLQSPLDDLLYRIELCDPSDCVSSYYQSISKPINPTTVSVVASTPDTRWQPYLNKAGNLLVGLDTHAMLADVHFKINSRWTNASTVQVPTLSDSVASDISMSDTGDTFVIATYQETNSRISISVFDRLGEAWFLSSQWELPTQPDNSLLTERLVSIAGDANTLIVRSDFGWVLYERSDLNFSNTGEYRINGKLISWDASSDLSHVAWISENTGGELEMHKVAAASGVYEASTLPDDLPPLLVDSSQLQINTDGDEWLLAGWQSTQNQRYLLQLQHMAFTENTVTLLSTQTVTSAPNESSQLVLRSSDELEVSYVSWGDQQNRTTDLYHVDNTGLNRSFRLSDYIAPSPNTTALSLSGDGSTLSWAGDSIHTLE